MNKIEAAEYEKTMAQILRALEKYNRKIFKLKQNSFTNNQMVTRFYRHAEVDLKQAIEHLKNGYNLHTHHIVNDKEKQNVISSNRFDRERNN